jgi:hypothetical protein
MLQVIYIEQVELEEKICQEKVSLYLIEEKSKVYKK